MSKLWNANTTSPPHRAKAIQISSRNVRIGCCCWSRAQLCNLLWCWPSDATIVHIRFVLNLPESCFIRLFVLETALCVDICKHKTNNYSIVKKGDNSSCKKCWVFMLMKIYPDSGHCSKKSQKNTVEREILKLFCFFRNTFWRFLFPVTIIVSLISKKFTIVP